MIDKDSQKETEEYLNSLRRDCERDPGNFELHQYFAEELLHHGYNEEAKELFLSLIRECPNDDLLYYNLGIVYEKLDDPEKAVETYRKSIKLNPVSVDAHYNLAYLFDFMGEKIMAEEEYRKTLELDSKDSNSHFGLVCLLSDKGDSQGAIKHFLLATEYNPEDEIAFFNLAYEVQKQGDFDTALNYYKTVLELNPSYSWAYYNMGFIYFTRGDKLKAYQLFKSTYELNKLDYDAFEKFVSIGLAINKHSEMIEIIKKSLVSSPKSLYENYFLGDIYFSFKQYSTAYRYYKATLDLSKKIKLQTKIDLNRLRQRIELLSAKNTNSD